MINTEALYEALARGLHELEWTRGNEPKLWEELCEHQIWLYRYRANNIVKPFIEPEISKIANQAYEDSISIVWDIARGAGMANASSVEKQIRKRAEEISNVI